MPCRDIFAEEDARRETAKRLNEVTRMLCALCKRSEVADIEGVPGLNEWWHKHQEEDRRRVDAERKRLQAEKNARRREFLRLKQEFEPEVR